MGEAPPSATQALPCESRRRVPAVELTRRGWRAPRRSDGRPTDPAPTRPCRHRTPGPATGETPDPVGRGRPLAEFPGEEVAAGPARLLPRPGPAARLPGADPPGGAQLPARRAPHRGPGATPPARPAAQFARGH